MNSNAGPGMRQARRNLCLFGFLLVATQTPIAAQRKLPAQTGRITYQVKTATGAIRRLYAWTDGGLRFREDQSITTRLHPKARPTTLHMWTVGDRQHLYTFHGEGKRVTRSNAPRTPYYGTLNATLREPGAKVIGKEKIGGRTCEISLGEGGKYWHHKGLLIKMVAGPRNAPTMTITATKVELDARLSPSLFEVPHGYEITNAPARK